MSSVDVIVMPRYRVTQGSIGIVQFNELPAAALQVRIGVWVDPARFSAKGLFDLLRIGFGSNSQKTVVIDSGIGRIYDSERPGGRCEFFLKTNRVHAAITANADKGIGELCVGIGVRSDN